MKLLVVRHGQTIQNLQRVYQGRMGGDLSSEGKTQAQKLAKRLEDFQIDMVFSSDLKRAVDTASEIMAYHKGVEITFCGNLRERNRGEFEGKSMMNHRIDIFDPPKGVETTQQINQRIKSFFELVYNKYKDKTVLFVTHSLICRLYTAQFLNIPLENIYELPRPKNTGLYEIQVNQDNIQIILENDISHLNL